jgi:hypothetical protein
MQLGRNSLNYTENNKQTVPKMLCIAEVQFVKHILNKSVNQTVVL